MTEQVKIVLSNPYIPHNWAGRIIPAQIQNGLDLVSYMLCVKSNYDFAIIELDSVNRK